MAEASSVLKVFALGFLLAQPGNRNKNGVLEVIPYRVYTAHILRSQIPGVRRPPGRLLVGRLAGRLLGRRTRKRRRAAQAEMEEGVDTG